MDEQECLLTLCNVLNLLNTRRISSSFILGELFNVSKCDSFIKNAKDMKNLREDITEYINDINGTTPKTMKHILSGYTDGNEENCANRALFHFRSQIKINCLNALPLRKRFYYNLWLNPEEIWK